jgi:hypothetical protein
MKNIQLISDPGKVDCVRACITSILNIPNDANLPNVDSSDWYFQWHNLLDMFGIELAYERRSFWRSGYWIASVPSLNYPPPITHAIVMYGTDIYWDPSTKIKYQSGRSLLKENIVTGGFFLEITDSSKLCNLESFRSKYK